MVVIASTPVNIAPLLSPASCNHRVLHLPNFKECTTIRRQTTKGLFMLQALKRMIRRRDVPKPCPPSGINLDALHERDSTLTGWFNTDSRELFEGFVIDPDDLVVDVGCGEGLSAQFAVRCGAEVIATDSDPERVEYATKLIQAMAKRDFRVLQSDSNPLPLDDGIASKVICQEVLEHVDEPQQLMSELVRIGDASAQYLLCVPDPVSESIQREVADSVIWEKPFHIRVFEHDQFDRLVQDAGLVIEKRGCGSFYWTMMLMLFWASELDFDALTGAAVKSWYEQPLMREWAKTWQTLLATPKGVRVKRAFDKFMPKSQIIIARKPA